MKPPGMDHFLPHRSLQTARILPCQKIMPWRRPIEFPTTALGRILLQIGNKPCGCRRIESNIPRTSGNDNSREEWKSSDRETGKSAMNPCNVRNVIKSTLKTILWMELMVVEILGWPFRVTASLGPHGVNNRPHKIASVLPCRIASGWTLLAIKFLIMFGVWLFPIHPVPHHLCRPWTSTTLETPLLAKPGNLFLRTGL
jgi:hypothetical protein